jgi:MoxR-like ATPase
MNTVKPSKLIDVLIDAIKLKAPCLIVGKPGIGKTDLVHQACEATDSDLIIDYPAVSDPTDYKGLPMPDADGESAHFRPFGNLLQLVKAEKSTVFFEDEVGQASDSVQKALMHLNLARTVNGHKISDHVTIFAATNRREDRAGVTGLLETLKRRFWGGIYHLEPDLDDWVKWALANDIPVEIIAHARFRPEFITMQNWKPTPDMVNSPSPATIAGVAKWMKMGIRPDQEFDRYSAVAGEAYAADLLGFLKIYRNLPSIDLICLNPDKETVPTDPATLWAVCGALVAKANQQTIGNIIKYANRMRPEFSVMLVKDIITKNKALVNTKAFIDWSVKHSDVLS